MWALARFCAPCVSNAGEKEKNALPRGRKAFGMWGFGTTGRGLGASQGILFLLAWQLIAVQKACQSPHAQVYLEANHGFPA